MSVTDRVPSGFLVRKGSQQIKAIANAPGTRRTRRGAFVLLTVSALILAFAQRADANPAPRDAVPGELLVRYVPGTTGNAREEARDRAGVVAKRDLLLADLQLVRTEAGISIESALATLNRDRRVRYAEPHFLYAPTRVPDDPRFGEQWNLHNVGQVIAGVQGTPGADISAPAAWSVATGSQAVKVAVLDTGIEYFNHDIRPNMWRNPGELVPGEDQNGLDDDGNGFEDDLYGWDFLSVDGAPLDEGGTTGHGTPVAGIIGAVGDNGRGIAGINWKTKLLSLRVCNSGCPSTAIIDATVYASRVGADIGNLSFGGEGYSQAHRDAMIAASETLFVASAGNDGTNNDTTPQYPCGYDLPNIICVTATDNRDSQVFNYGAESVDLGAPGIHVLAPSLGHRKVLRDEFADAERRWDYTDSPLIQEPNKWERTLTTDVDRTFVLDEDALGKYGNNADVRATLNTPLDLSNERGCIARLQSVLETESSKDYLRLEAATDPNGPYEELIRASGATGGFWRAVSADLDDYEGARVYLRLRFTSDGENVADGVTIDDVEVRCEDASASYEFVSGTSLAAPHVAGAAALVKSHMPGLSVAELRERILRTVDRLPSLEGKTVTGGRLNVARALTADLDPPVVSVVSRPDALSNSAAASFGFSASEAGSTFECRLDGGSFGSCSSPKAYTGLADGEHTFRVRASDPSGNVSDVVEVAWTIDTSAPAASITQAPASPTSSRSASFAFSSEAGAVFECRLDGGDFAACGSPRSYEDLGEGSHSFAVRARDAAGNVGAPAQASWVVDTGAPTVTVDTRPADLSNSSDAAFAFSGSEAGVSFECRLDGGAYADCSSPRQYAALADGEHSFAVRARDGAGNVGPGTVVEWVIDTLAPSAAIDERPTELSNRSDARFAFSASEAGAEFECRLDGGAFALCESPRDYDSLADGEHSFSVRARDAAGNVGSVAEASWTVDTVAPVVTIGEGPSGSTTARSATFSFTASEAVTGYECALDDAAFALCSSPMSYEGLPVGAHSFAVRARDEAGNWTAPAATRTWTVTEIESDPPPPDPTPTPEPTPTGTSAGSQPGGGPAPTPVLAAPDLRNAQPRAWSPPQLKVVLARQSLRAVLARGLRVATTTQAQCPCRIAYVLRIDRPRARGGRARPAPRIVGRGAIRVRAAGRSAGIVRVTRPARTALRKARRLAGHLDTTLADRHGRTVTTRQRVLIRR